MIKDEIYIDQAMIDDFFAEYEEAQIEVNFVIDHLLQTSDAGTVKEYIDRIFRRVHSIKSNFRMIGAREASEIIHSLETVLSDIRQYRHEDIEPFLYLIRIIVEEVRFLTLKGFQQSNADLSDELIALKANIACISGVNLSNKVIKFIKELQLQGDYEANFSLDALEEKKSSVAEDKGPIEPFLCNDFYLTIAKNSDLSFYKELIEQIECFMPFWKDRSKIILELLVKMNRFANSPVNEQQLIAAIFMHDIGMGFIAPHITHKAKELDAEEKIIMCDHIHQGTEFLKRIPNWEDAAQMVVAHHEHVDGSGYPMGLKNDKICDGAKLLAIGDAFWAMTHDRVYVYKKKPIINALMDINKKSGIKYDEFWVSVFTKVIKR